MFRTFASLFAVAVAIAFLGACATTPAQLAAEQAFNAQLLANQQALSQGLNSLAVASANNAAQLAATNAQIIQILGPINCNGVPLVNTLVSDVAANGRLKAAIKVGNVTAAALCAAATGSVSAQATIKTAS